MGARKPHLNSLTDSVIAAPGQHAPAGSYQNFPNRSIDNWAEQYYGENLQQLIEVKAAYDPANLFNNPQSIPVSQS